MLSEFGVKNFKSIADSTLPLSRVNVLIGGNGTGKSSYVQALMVLKQSLGTSLKLAGPLVDLGQFSSVLHRDAQRPAPVIGFALNGAAHYDTQIMIQDARSNRVSFAYSWEGNDQTATEVHETLTLGPTLSNGPVVHVNWVQGAPGGNPVPPELVVGLNAYSLGASIAIGQGIGRGPARLGATNARDQALSEDAISRFLAAPSVVIGRCYFVPAMRGLEHQSFDLGERSTLDLVSPEGSLQLGQQLATTMAYERQLEAQIADWMERVTKRRVAVHLEPPRRVSVEAVDGKRVVNIVNEGFGTNQLTHALTQLALLQSDGLIVVEEPESHLHPAAQVDFINVLVEATKAKQSQLLLTTHSEHILYALIALIAESKLHAADVVISHVAIEDGHTVLNRLELDESGRVKGGLPGFFNVQVQEFRRFLDAAEKAK